METRLSAFLNKEAGRYSDFIGSALSGAAVAPIIGFNPGGFTELVGRAVPQGVKKDKPQTTGQAALSFIPGVGGYRMGAVRHKVHEDYVRRKKKNSNMWHELLGALPSSLIGAGVGGALGYGAGKLVDSKITPFDPAKGVFIGSMAGAVSPILVAALAAAITKTRTTKEQDEAESGKETAANYLVPGRAVYNDFKRLGHGYAKYQEGTVK